MLTQLRFRDTDSMEIFGSRLDKFWKDQAQKFDYKANKDTTHSQQTVAVAARLESQAHFQGFF